MIPRNFRLMIHWLWCGMRNRMRHMIFGCGLMINRFRCWVMNRCMIKRLWYMQFWMWLMIFGLRCVIMRRWLMVYNSVMGFMMMSWMHHMPILLHVVPVHWQTKNHFHAKWMSCHCMFVIVVISFILFVGGFIYCWLWRWMI